SERSGIKPLSDRCRYVTLGGRLELLVHHPQSLAEVLDELKQDLRMLVDDRLHAVAPEYTHGRARGGLRACAARLVVEDRHLPHDLAGAVAGQGHFVAVVVEMNAHLTFEHHIQLRADIAFPKDRLASDVMPGDHQPVDGRELLE